MVASKVASKSRKEKKYGEKDSRLNEFRQKDQPPAALRRAVGNDKEAMAFCPSYGQPNLGDQAEPLPPESKDDYVRRKARKKEAKAQAIRSKQGQAKGPSKMTVKRKPCLTRTPTFPPALPSPIMTVFSVTPPPPIIQPSTTQGALPRDARAPSPSLPWHTLSYSMPLGPLDSHLSTVAASTVLDPVYQPPPAAREACEQYAHNAAYPGFHVAPQIVHATDSRTTTLYLETDRGNHSIDPSPPPPGIWPQSPGLSARPPSPYTASQLDPGLSAACGSTQSENCFNAVYKNFFVRRALGGDRWATPPLTPEHKEAPSVVPNIVHMSRNTDTSNLLHHPPPSVISSPDASTCASFSMGMDIWTSKHQWGEPAANPSGASSRYKWRDPVERGEARATSTPGTARYGSATPATFDAEFSSPGYFNALSAGYTHPIHLATAEFSAVPVYAEAEITQPIVTSIPHQLLQHNVSARQARTPLNNGYGVSRRSSPSYAHFGHVRTAPTTYATTPSRLASPTNQYPSGGPTTVNVQQDVQSARIVTRISEYSELAHALVDYHAEAPPTSQPSAAHGAVEAPLSSPQFWGGAIGSLSANASGHVASQLESPDDEMARIFEGCFDDCEPLPLPIVSLLFGADFAAGQSSDTSQQLLTTSTWQEAQV